MRPERFSRRERVLAAVFVLLVPAVLLAPALAPGATAVTTRDLAKSAGWILSRPASEDTSIGHPDIVNQVYPFEAFALDCVARGDSPFLWNPRIHCGTRNHLNSPIRSALFWLPARALPLPAAHTWMILLQPQLMGLFTWLWIRTLGVRPAAAALGATAFPLHGSLIAWMYPEILETALWMPLLLYGIERYRATRRISWIGLAGLAAGIEALSGHPQYTLYAWSFAALYIVVRAAGDLVQGVRPAGAVLRRHAALFAIFPIGLAIGAAQLLPLALFLPESHRSLPFNLKHKGGGDAAALIEMDHLATQIDYLATVWNPFHPSRFTRWWPEVCAYAGLAIPLLALYAVLRRRARARPVLELATLVLFLGIVIYDGPLSRLFRSLPGFDTSVLGRWAFLLVLALAALASAGLERVLEEDLRSWRLGKWLLAGAVVAAAALLLEAGILEWLSGRERIQMLDRAIDPDPYHWTNPRTWRPFLLLGIGFLLVVLWQRFVAWRKVELGRRLFLILVLLVQAGDLLDFDRTVWAPGRAADLYPRKPWTQALAEATREPPSRVAMISRERYGGNRLIPFGFESPLGYSSAYNRRNYLYFWARAYLTVRLTHKNSIYIHPDTEDRYRWSVAPTLALCNVRFVLADEDLEGRFPNLVPIPRRPDPSRPLPPELRGHPFREGLPEDFPDGLYLYEVAIPSSRLQRVSRALFVNRKELTFAETMVPTFHPSRFVVLEREMEEERVFEPAWAAGRGAAGPAGNGRARFLSRRTNRVLIETWAPEPGWLVIFDSWDPGWRATVNGSPAETLRADCLFRAVRVPAGRSEVVWSFWPPGLTAGIAVSITGMLAAAGLLLTALARRRPRRPAV